jgi:hypothetical protein
MAQHQGIFYIVTKGRTLVHRLRYIDEYCKSGSAHPRLVLAYIQHLTRRTGKRTSFDDFAADLIFKPDSS